MNVGCFPLLLSILFFETEFLIEIRQNMEIQLDKCASEPLYSKDPGAELQGCDAKSGFYVGAGDLKSALNACTGSTLPTEQPPGP